MMYNNEEQHNNQSISILVSISVSEVVNSIHMVLFSHGFLFVVTNGWVVKWKTDCFEFDYFHFTSFYTLLIHLFCKDFLNILVKENDNDKQQQQQQQAIVAKYITDYQHQQEVIVVKYINSLQQLSKFRSGVR